MVSVCTVYIFSFNLFVSLYVEWVSCMQHKVVASFLIRAEEVCLLIELYRPILLIEVILLGFYFPVC